MRSSPLTHKKADAKAHTGSEKLNTPPAAREILVLQTLAAQNEKKVRRLGLKLCLLALSSLSREQADRKLVPYLMEATEFVEEVNERAEMACAGKLPAQETIQSILRMMGSVDICMNPIDSHLLNATQPLSPFPEEMLDVILSKALSAAEPKDALCSLTHPTRVGNTAAPPVGIWEMLCRWLFLGEAGDAGSGISSWDFWQSF